MRRTRVHTPTTPADGTVEAAIPEEHTWRLSDLFADLDAFASAREDVRSRSLGLERWRGRLAESGAVLAQALDATAEVAKDLNRLHAYASMRSDDDTRVPSEQGRRQEVELLWHDHAGRTSWMRPEILAIAPDRLDGYLRDEAALAPHRHFLEDLARTRAHVRGPDEEAILAEAGQITGSANSLYGVFHNAEMPRPEITLADGRPVRLTPASFAQHRTSANREDRARLFEAFFDAYVPFRETMGHNLFDGVKAHVFRARSRRYPSCLHAALDGDAVPTAVYENLIAQVRDALPILHRAIGVRARALGIARPAYHDLHCPLVPDLGKTFTPDEAAAVLRRALLPLGPEYARALERCFTDRWIDWHPKPGKRSGAYSAGSAYDVHPYILMNFHGDYEGVSTLAHEVGHALHSHFSNRAQPYATADYSIFVAEVASTFNEALLNATMLDEATSERERMFLLGTFVDQMRATLFRQTMFAEFELAIHRHAEAGRALTGESLSETYLDLVRTYHGHDDGILEVADRYAVEWAAVPHFYYGFYVYQYATGIVASTALAESVRAGGDDAARRYRAFLAAGGSDYPLAILREAGVDLEAAEPYRRTFEALERALGALERLLDRRESGSETAGPDPPDAPSSSGD